MTTTDWERGGGYSPGMRLADFLHINHEDTLVTRRLVEAGEMLDIEVLDHLVIGQQRYVSLKERGLGFD